MTGWWLDDVDVRIAAGDCCELMPHMQADSVDAIVCDPPYALGFMGKEWDRPNSAARVRKSDADLSGTPYGRARAEYGASAGYGRERADLREFQAWCTEWGTEALRVLKPGGHLLAFGGTRTFHRLTSGLEDAGFEIRDCLSWLYGSGFPKSLDVAKAIDKAAGAEREDVYDSRTPVTTNTAYGKGLGVGLVERRPVTDAARQWEGWGTALKPAWEPAVLARKPLAGTVAGNVQQHGTGALNIDGCRIGTTADRPGTTPPSTGERGSMAGNLPRTDFEPHDRGRWPANVMLDPDAARMLDDQAGDRPGFRSGGSFGAGFRDAYVGGTGRETYLPATHYGDTGGPSRFFYTAKASTAERNNGHGPANTHPTVKPVDLMRWCIRLITPPGGLVLDPFAGSGTTGVAARAEGMRCILIEREQEYLQIIAGRLAQLSLLGGAA